MLPIQGSPGGSSAGHSQEVIVKPPSFIVFSGHDRHSELLKPPYMLDPQPVWILVYR